MRNTRASTVVIGMDEAGRGPVIGPMVIGLVIVTKSQISTLKKSGVMDSKVLNHNRRVELSKLIKENVIGYGTLIVTAKQIDKLRQENITLNQIEIMAFRELLDHFITDKNIILQLDAADVNADRFGKNFTDMVDGKIDSRHKGDVIFPAVSAASILAKIMRDRKVEEIQEIANKFDATLPKVGSGYPNKISKKFLSAYYKKYQQYPEYVRKTWNTAIRIKKEMVISRTKLHDYF